jgi:Ino eighty subunit 1
MRAQLRTYHSIPSLQARQDPNAYKQLQDAPRLKSILKGATEDEEQPSTVEDIKNHPVPRTNPVNLIFVLSQYAPKISELHFFPPRDFFDLVMRPNLSSRSRATAFLWLMWWYLESDFSKEAAQSNPFGPGQYGPPGDPATAGHPIKCPAFDFLTPEQEALENVDTTEEKNFGEIKRKERIGMAEPLQTTAFANAIQLYLGVIWRRSSRAQNETVKRVSQVFIFFVLSVPRRI